MRRVMIAALVAVLAAFSASAESGLPRIDDGKVIMKWADFEKILEELLKEAPEEEEPVPPPVGYSIKSAAYQVSIKEKYADIEATYSVEVIDDKKWVIVPVGDSSSGIHKVLVDGAPALVATMANREAWAQQAVQSANAMMISSDDSVIILKGKGERKVRVFHTVAAPMEPGPNGFGVKVAGGRGGAVSLTAPADLSDLAIQGAVITSSDKTAGAWSVKALSGMLDRLHVSYTLPVPEGVEEIEKLPPKLYSALELMLSISDEVTKANARFAYDIKHSPLSQFNVNVPKGFDVINVEAQGVSGWKVTDDVLNVMVNYEVQGSYYLSVHLEAARKEASGDVKIPELVTRDAERESGFIGVETRDSLEVKIKGIEGLTPIDASELPRSLSNQARYPILHSFRFSKHPYGGTLAVIRHKEVEVLTATIDTVNVVTLFTEDGKSATRVIYEIRNNKRQYIKIELPDQAEVWSAYLDNEPVKPAVNKAGQTLIPLKKSGTGTQKVSFSVELIYYAPIPEMEKSGRITTVFPKADIPASEMLVSMYLPAKFKYKDFKGDLEEADELFKPGIQSFYIEPTSAEPVERERRKLSKRAFSRQMQMEQEIADEIQEMQAEPDQYFYDDKARAPAPPAKKPAPSAAPRRTGMLPVQFNVPLRGETHRFSKLLVMDEAPELRFEYKKLRKYDHWFFKLLKGLWPYVRFILIVLFLALVLYAVIRLARRKSLPSAPPPVPPAQKEGQE